MSQRYNLLWLGLRLLDDHGRESETSVEPISQDKMDNLLRIAETYSDTDVRLWIDSKRMTDNQLKWLKSRIAESGMSNLSVGDLRKENEYVSRDIFNHSEIAKNWRNNKHSLIWRQVDVAKLLICFFGDYDRVYYSDMDTFIDLNSSKVLESMARDGFVVGGVFHEDRKPGIENQAFGFCREKIHDFEVLFNKTVMRAIDRENGYLIFGETVRKWVNGDTDKIAIDTELVGNPAWHPEKETEFKQSTIKSEGLGLLK